MYLLRVVFVFFFYLINLLFVYLLELFHLFHPFTTLKRKRKEDDIDDNTKQDNCYSPVMRKRMADKERQEIFVQGSGLDWVIVRPGELTDGSYDGKYTFGTDASIMAGKISRANVADFVLRNLNDDQFLGRAVAIS